MKKLFMLLAVVCFAVGTVGCTPEESDTPATPPAGGAPEGGSNLPGEP